MTINTVRSLVEKYAFEINVNPLHVKEMANKLLGNGNHTGVYMTRNLKGAHAHALVLFENRDVSKYRIYSVISSSSFIDEDNCDKFKILENPIAFPTDLEYVLSRLVNAKIDNFKIEKGNSIAGLISNILNIVNK